MKVFGMTIGGGGDAPQLLLGGPPAAELLPPEVGAARRSRGIRRGIVAVAVLLMVASGGASAAAKYQALSAEVELALEQERTASLIARQAEFADIVAAQTEIEEREAARRVATGTEIDWQVFVSGIEAAMPADMVLHSLEVTGSSPMAGLAQPADPLQGARVATVTCIVRSPAMLTVPDVVDLMGGLTGFVDAQVPLSELKPEGYFETTFVVHLDEGAYASRFPAAEASEHGVADGRVEAGASGEGVQP
ncbi:hypothetical protein [Agrococcus sp. TF02-05]|uniref:hypothetical protein n=1 Tax=Agrococcus sp. TF02-05 TaxID=2815211 RepID=UPI001AA15337|nr:hypothetical protein [Agrococcus sp. TF02-05]MBO1769326.1 hypothetical protein [Agrococcus sp. TF02-05]